MQYPILIPFQRYGDLNTGVIVRLFDEVIQSNANIQLDRGLTAKVVHVRAPVGGMPKVTYRGDWDTHQTRLNGHGSRFVHIANDDALCCARAIVTGKAHTDHKLDPTNVMLKRTYDALRKGDVARRTHQRVRLRMHEDH